MKSEPIPIRTKFNEQPKTLVRIHLPELCGNDELSVDGINTAAGLRLLARLLEGNQYGALNVYTLTASQRDLMWAAMHRQYWGNRIVSSLCCNACGADFDLSFLLSDLQKSLWANVEPHAEVNAPTGIDEMAIAEQSIQPNQQAEMLKAMCLNNNSGMTELDAKQLERCLNEQAPIMDVDLKAHCTECQHENTVRFDVQSYVLQKIMNEHDVLWGQVDALAKKYRWSLSEILSLKRSIRHQLSQ